MRSARPLAPGPAKTEQVSGSSAREAGERPLVTRDGPVAVYRQIAQSLAERIQSGQLAQHDRLPSEQALQDEFQVSRVTVRLSLRLLAERGLIASHQGRGSFVVGVPVVHDADVLTGFYDTFLKQGIQPETRLLSLRYGVAPDEPALRGPDGRAKVCRFTRQYLVRNHAVAVVNGELREFGNGYQRASVERLPIYALLQQIAKVTVARAETSVRAVTAPAAICRQLELPLKSIVLALYRVSYDSSGSGCEASLIHIRPEHYEVRFAVKGPLQIAPSIRALEPSGPRGINPRHHAL